MGFEELRTKLYWFAQEKGNLEDAEEAVRSVHSDTEAIAFNVGSNTNLVDVKAAYDDLRSAVLDEPKVSLDAGGDLLDSLADAIGATGSNYLVMESQNTAYAAQILALIEQEGL